MESCSKCLGVFFFSCLRKLYIFLSFLLEVFWIDHVMHLIIYFHVRYDFINICILRYTFFIWPIYHSFAERTWFTRNFFFLTVTLTLFIKWYIYRILTFFLSQLLISITELPKFIPSTLLATWGHIIFLVYQPYFDMHHS